MPTTKIVTAAAAAGSTGSIQTGPRPAAVSFTFCGDGYSGDLVVKAGDTEAGLAQVWTTTLTLNSDCSTVYTPTTAKRWYKVEWTRTAGTLDVSMSLEQGDTVGGGGITNTAPSGTMPVSIDAAGNMGSSDIQSGGGYTEIGGELYADNEGNYIWVEADGITVETSAGPIVIKGKTVINLDSVTTIAAGTRAAPSLALKSDLDTGFYDTGAGLMFCAGNNDNIYIQGYQTTFQSGSDVIFEAAYLKLSDIPTYADNTAAAALATGRVYKTATGELRIKV